MSQIKKLITRKYMIAIIIIGLLDTFSFTSLLIAINMNKDNAYLINLSGRQRMLSQRIALQLNQLQNLEQTENQNIITKLNKDINDFEKANLILTHKHKKIHRSIPKNIQDFYFQQNGTDSKSKYFISRARQIIEEKATDSELFEFTYFVKEELLESLHKSVQLFESESNQLNRSLINIEVLIYFMAFLNLGLILKLIFIPMRDTLAKREDELFQMVSKLKEEGKYKSTFLSNMGHELRTPLNGILGVVELLHDNNLNDEQSKLVNIIEESGKNLLNTLDDILDLTRLEMNKFLIEPKDFSPRRMIDQISERFRAQAEQKDLIFERQCSELPDILYGDEHKIKQVLNNLLGNAIKYTEHGNVKVVASYDSFSSQFVIKVHDSGIGISEENIKLIFDPFKQVDSTTARLYGGSGLGLAISRQITEAMKGTLKVNSKRDVGSTFTLALPLKKREHGLRTTLFSDEPDEFYKGNILLIEANEVNRNLITRIITRLGPTVESALSYKVASRLINTRSYRIAFISTSIEGHDILHSLEDFVRKVPDTTKVYLMTSGEEIHLSKKLHERVSDVIEGPIQKSKFTKIISNHLEKDESN